MCIYFEQYFETISDLWIVEQKTTVNLKSKIISLYQNLCNENIM